MIDQKPRAASTKKGYPNIFSTRSLIPGFSQSLKQSKQMNKYQRNQRRIPRN